MKTIQTNIAILSVALMFSSCSNKEKGNQNSTGNPLSIISETEDSAIGQIDAAVKTYLYLKDGLVNEDSKIAAEAGDDLSIQMEDIEVDNYEKADQEKLHKIIGDAAKQAQFISESSIDIQRRHFDTLSKDMIALIEITGTSKKLYQVYCPMYNNDKGAQWLSDTEEIKNPYFGNEKMSCGEIVKEIN